MPQEKNLNSIKMKSLFSAIASLDSEAEAKNFMRDLLTISELEEAALRFDIAKRVTRKESYRSISKNTGASTATITRVSHWIHHGMGGYNHVLSHLKK
ncbi:TrpR-like protein YerC/YecD [Patescibacteria group bacterium]|nr:TrpR-like protein YerC/YecD [Patescibacteria group bacterium]